MKPSTHILFLKRCLQERQERNPSYSLRSFADTLNISPSHLSRVMNGEKLLSPEKAEGIFEKICNNDTEKKQLLDSVLTEQSSKRKKTSALKKSLSIEADKVENINYNTLDSWYHSVLLELISIKSFQYCYKWISKKLNITEFLAKKAVQDLNEMGLIKIENNNLSRGQQLIASKSTELSSLSLRKIQKEIREKSIDALEEVNIKNRSHTHITMAIDLELLPEAKQRIQEFQKEMCHFLESKNKEKVYIMEIGLFPGAKDEI